MEKERPSISVIMCTYNGEKYLREQLDSIIQQTYPITELLIQDDCSIDGTYNLLCEYADKYEFISIYQNPEQLGINLNFYSLLKKAHGDFIAISDQDDIWELNKIEIQVNSIKNNWLSSGFSRPFISESGVKVHFDERVPNCSLLRMMYVGIMPGHTMLLNRILLEKVNLLTARYPQFMYDHLIQMVAAAYEKTQFCNAVLVNNRRHIHAATYTRPENYHWNIANVTSSIRRTLNLYFELKPAMRKYFLLVYEFLSQIDSNNSELKSAILIAKYQSGKTFWDYIRLTILCTKNYNRIFYCKQLWWKGVLRALYFPISCSDYFRFLSKRYQ